MTEALKGKEKFIQFEAGTIYEATLGGMSTVGSYGALPIGESVSVNLNMGFHTSEEEAKAAIMAYNPRAVRCERIPAPTKLSEGEYYIQPRTLYTTDQAYANVLKELLKLKKESGTEGFDNKR